MLQPLPESSIAFLWDSLDNPKDDVLWCLPWKYIGSFSNDEASHMAQDLQRAPAPAAVHLLRRAQQQQY